MRVIFIFEIFCFLFFVSHCFKNKLLAFLWLTGLLPPTLFYSLFFMGIICECLTLFLYDFQAFFTRTWLDCDDYKCINYYLLYFLFGHFKVGAWISNPMYKKISSNLSSYWLYNGEKKNITKNEHILLLWELDNRRKKWYRSNYKKCCNRKSLHSKRRNRIYGTKEKTKTV